MDVAEGSSIALYRGGAFQEKEQEEGTAVPSSCVAGGKISCVIHPHFHDRAMHFPSQDYISQDPLHQGGAM